MDPKTPEPFTPRTRAEIETALAERKALTALAAATPKEPGGQAPAGAPPIRKQKYPHPAAPPAPTVDVEKVTSARDKKLAEINAKVIEMRRLEVELETKKTDLAMQIKKATDESRALVAQKELLELQVGQIQSELARQEALDLLGQQETAQARANAVVPGEQAAREVEALLKPLIVKTVIGLSKLKGLLATHGSALERISKLRAPAGFTDENDRVSYIETTSRAGKILDELHASIKQHERALHKASTLTSRATLNVDPEGVFGSEPDHTLVCEVQRDLEEASGMVQQRRFGSSIKVATSETYNHSGSTSTVERSLSASRAFSRSSRRSPSGLRSPR